ncbi:hypothetical protein RI367_001783 [Sorochytrium milnesiophthora]
MVSLGFPTSRRSTVGSPALQQQQQQQQRRVTASISMADIADTRAAYKDVYKAAAVYRKQVKAVSKHARDFAAVLTALADTAHAIGPESTNPIRRFAEIQELYASSHEAMLQMLETQFEEPLKTNYINHKENIKTNEKKFKTAQSLHSAQIKSLERAESRALRSARQDIDTYQGTLRDLSRMTTSLEVLKNENFDNVYGEEVRNLDFVSEKCIEMMALQCNMFFGKIHYRALGYLNDFGVQGISSALADPRESIQAGLTIPRGMAAAGSTTLSRRVSTSSRHSSVYGEPSYAANSLPPVPPLPASVPATSSHQYTPISSMSAATAPTTASEAAVAAAAKSRSSRARSKPRVRSSAPVEDDLTLTSLKHQLTQPTPAPAMDLGIYSHSAHDAAEEHHYHGHSHRHKQDNDALPAQMPSPMMTPRRPSRASAQPSDRRRSHSAYKGKEKMHPTSVRPGRAMASAE